MRVYVCDDRTNCSSPLLDAVLCASVCVCVDVTQPTFASFQRVSLFVCILQPPRDTIQCVIAMTQADVLYLNVCVYVCVCVCVLR